MSDTYGNINDAVTEDNKYCIDYLYTAMEKLGIKPITLAMRGGTDGSFISTKGILTPNYFTAGHNFHSNCEFYRWARWKILQTDAGTCRFDLQ